MARGCFRAQCRRMRWPTSSRSNFPKNEPTRQWPASCSPTCSICPRPASTSRPVAGASRSSTSTAAESTRFSPAASSGALGEVRWRDEARQSRTHARRESDELLRKAHQLHHLADLGVIALHEFSEIISIGPHGLEPALGHELLEACAVVDLLEQLLVALGDLRREALWPHH